MEDNFRLRVEKAFGSLSSSSPTSSLWCLSDEEIERREWDREREVSPDVDENYNSKIDGGVDFFSFRPEAQSSDQNFSGQLLSDLGEVNDGGINTRRRKRGDVDSDFSSELERREDEDEDDKEWDIASSIGLDCTLDYEEEEDQHDRFAVGREGAGDRLYMRDMYDCGTGAELPGVQNKFNRDTRADHMAAKLRLREDAEAAGDFDSLNLADADTSMPPPLHTLSSDLETGVNLKPILKKKEISTETRSAKRVRFEEPFLGSQDAAENYQVEDAAELEDTDNVLGDQLSKEEAKSADGVNWYSTSIDEAAKDEASYLAETTARVPDYVRNPSRYTRYTLDSSDNFNEESNKKAYMDFLNLVKKPNATELEVDNTSVNPLKSLIFTPKKKAHDTSLVEEESMLQQNQVEVLNDKALPVSIAAGDAEDGEVSAVEEDGQGIAVDKRLSMQKPSRQYRTRTNTDNGDHIT